MMPVDFIGGEYIDKEFDCWSLCRLVAEKVYGLWLPSYGDLYTSGSDGVEAAFAIWSALQMGDWEMPDVPQPGDILIFRIGRFDCHAGVYIGDGDFIHCLKGRNTTIQRLDTDGWDDRMQGVWRWKPR